MLYYHCSGSDKEEPSILPLIAAGFNRVSRNNNLRKDKVRVNTPNLATRSCFHNKLIMPHLIFLVFITIVNGAKVLVGL